MSVIISGMTMPENCQDCPLFYDYLHCCVNEAKPIYKDGIAQKPDDSPLKEEHLCHITQ